MPLLCAASMYSSSGATVESVKQPWSTGRYPEDSAGVTFGQGCEVISCALGFEEFPQSGRPDNLISQYIAWVRMGK
jgi:hypothetical protein